MRLIRKDGIMKIAVYGTGEVAETFCSILNKRKEPVEIVYFIQTEKNMELFLGKQVISLKEMKYSDFDFLVIASNVYYQEMLTCLKKLNHDYEQYQNKVKKYDEWLPVKWEAVKSIMPLQSCKVSGDLVYAALSDDEIIPRYMFETGRNFSDVMIEAFFELVQIYYPGAKKEDGYFLDIGANIGTTSIYVKKKMNTKARVIGFELCRPNYDFFRINCILNKTEDIKAELLGLSNTTVRKKYFYNTQNSGGSRILEEDIDSKDANIVQVMKLDDYLKENNILPEDIGYIWMDTEGHEAEIIEGAAETLRTKKIPLLQEFNPVEYQRKNILKAYCKNMKNIYGHFLDVNEYIKGNKNAFPIDHIYDFAIEMEGHGKVQTDLFFF